MTIQFKMIPAIQEIRTASNLNFSRFTQLMFPWRQGSPLTMHSPSWSKRSKTVSRRQIWGTDVITRA